MTAKLDDLIALAREPSSQRRRELLRGVTDLFFSATGPHDADELALFDDVLGSLAREMEEEVRAELSARISGSTQAPVRLVTALAKDESIAVAAPALSSPVLGEAVLLEVARTRGQAHLRVISRREDLSEPVSDVLVDRGDDETLRVLLRNSAAPLSRRAAEKVVDRAAEQPALHQVMVSRDSLPLDLLNEMYFVVEHRLRQQIMARNANVDPGELETALAVARKRVAARDGALPPDYDKAEAYVRSMTAAGKVTPAALAALLRNGQRTHFLVALAELAEIDFHTARRIVDGQQLDLLAIICRGADFDRNLFLTFCVLILPPGQGMAGAEEYGRRYLDLPRDTALRTLRFWRMRRQTGDIAAA